MRGHLFTRDRCAVRRESTAGSCFGFTSAAMTALVIASRMPRKHERASVTVRLPGRGCYDFAGFPVTAVLLDRSQRSKSMKK